MFRIQKSSILEYVYFWSILRIIQCMRAFRIWDLTENTHTEKMDTFWMLKILNFENWLKIPMHALSDLMLSDYTFSLRSHIRAQFPDYLGTPLRAFIHLPVLYVSIYRIHTVYCATAVCTFIIQRYTVLATCIPQNACSRSSVLLYDKADLGRALTANRPVSHPL